MHLPVPIRRQIRDGFCLPACIEMVLASLSIRQDQAAIARALGTLPGVGTPISAVTKLATRIRDLGTLNAVFFATGEPDELKQVLNEGSAPILRVLTGQLPYWSEDTPHAVVLVDLDDNIATVNDPAFDEPQRVSFDELCLAWDDGGNTYVVIRSNAPG